MRVHRAPKTDMSLEAYFPNLRGTGYKITSPATIEYNCIAWSAGEQNRWWWPDAQEQHYWPAKAPREESVEAFTAAFEVIGFALCLTAELEPGFQKVAIFANEGLPTHAARQLDDGRWTSKLGPNVDIEHVAVSDIAGEIYGRVVIFLRRER